jgi:hypothetical protein
MDVGQTSRTLNVREGCRFPALDDEIHQLMARSASSPVSFYSRFRRACGAFARK